MKKVLLILVAGISLVACNSGDKKLTEREKFVKDSIAAEKKRQVLNDTANFTTIQWLDSTYVDLGKVKEGPELEVSFRFKNTGDKPLVIQDVHAQCGCTIPETPKEPFAPGQEGMIKAKFTTTNHVGTNTKTITVTANTKNTTSHLLTFAVNVEKSN